MKRQNLIEARADVAAGTALSLFVDGRLVDSIETDTGGLTRVSWVLREDTLIVTDNTWVDGPTAGVPPAGVYEIDGVLTNP